MTKARADFVAVRAAMKATKGLSAVDAINRVSTETKRSKGAVAQNYYRLARESKKPTPTKQTGRPRKAAVVTASTNGVGYRSPVAIMDDLSVILAELHGAVRHAETWRPMAEKFAKIRESLEATV